MQGQTSITSPTDLNIQPRLVPLIANFLKKKQQHSSSERRPVAILEFRNAD